MSRGIIIAAPMSGSGKTTVTLGLLRALRNAGVPVRGAKSGPDYIDPRFHEAACGESCLNLDAWAMTPTRIRSLASGSGLLIIEGAMGLFDGAPPKGRGATADLARILKLPVVLVVDAARMAQSIRPLVAGFAAQDPEVQVAGLILNNIGSNRHETMLRHALQSLPMPVLACLPRDSKLKLPSRHLGLVQASEKTDLDQYIEQAAANIGARIDLQQLQDLAEPLPDAARTPPLPPLAQKIAVAQDAAFAFAYPHILADWHNAGASLSFFSPLADEAPAAADLTFLPGGYPELHAGQLAAANNFRAGMLRAAKTGAVYGECGGYMVMGQGLVDTQGKSHEMLGLLDLETSFARRKMHLGYRRLRPLGAPYTQACNGHEFHYATTLSAKGQPLFKATNAEGDALPDMGLQKDNSSGSFAHIIDFTD